MIHQQFFVLSTLDFRGKKPRKWLQLMESFSGRTLFQRSQGLSPFFRGVCVAKSDHGFGKIRILRIGLWSSALFSALNLTAAILAILFTEQEWNHQKCSGNFRVLLLENGDLLMPFEWWPFHFRIPKVREEFSGAVFERHFFQFEFSVETSSNWKWWKISASWSPWVASWTNKWGEKTPKC